MTNDKGKRKGLTVYKWMIYSIIALLGLIIVGNLPASRALADTPQVKAGVFKNAPCPLLQLEEANGSVTCGKLTVPERHSHPRGPTIQLGVVIIHSLSDAPAPDPLLLLQGGPGGSTIDTYALPMAGQSNIRAQRDIVLFDQRGTMHSEPFLSCPEYLDYVQETLDKNLSPEEDVAGSINAELACRDRLQAEGVNLPAFNSLENAADIEALRLALGYEQINLYGVSYGTLLAQHFMRDFPAGLRSVILDAVVPTGVNFVTEIPRNMSRAHETLFQACAKDPECNAGYPDLEQVFFNLAAELNKEPLPIPMTDPETNRSYQWLFNGNDLIETTFQLLYGAEIIPALPMLIYDIKAGQSDFISTIMPLLIFDRTMGIGMYDSVMCAEDADFTLDEVSVGGIRSEFVENTLIQTKGFLRLCSQWGAPDLGARVDAPVVSDVPTLILSGQFDPITPPEFGHTVAQSLPNSYAYTFPNTGHGAFLSSQCAENILLDFLNNPDSAPNSDCISQEGDLSFLLAKDIFSTAAMRKVLGLFEGRYLAGATVLGLSLMFLLSAFAVWPSAWLIQTLRERPPANPPPWRWAAILLILAAGAISFVFLIGVAALIVTVGFNNEMLLLLGAPRAWGALFALPPLTAGLTIGALIFALLSWRGGYWSIWQRIYYSLLALSALNLSVVFFSWGVMTVLW